MAAAARRKSNSPKSRSKRAATARRRRKPARSVMSRARNVMTNAMSGDMGNLQAEVGQLVNDLEQRLNKLNRVTRRGTSNAADGVNELVFNAVAGLTDRLRNGAMGVSDDAAKYGNQALRQISTQIDRHPLMTLAIAAGLGFLAGLAQQRR